MRCKRYLWMILVFCSCGTGKSSQDKEFVKWIGKEIFVPTTLQGQVMGRDTNCADLFDKKYKMFRYVDSTGCCECKLQLRSWGKFVHAHKMHQDSIALILVVQAVNPRIVPILCEQNDFKQPIFMDRKGRMGKLNNIPGNIDGQVCLLDKDNRILAIGDPVNDPIVLKKYHELIGQKN